MDREKHIIYWLQLKREVSGYYTLNSSRRTSPVPLKLPVRNAHFSGDFFILLHLGNCFWSVARQFVPRGGFLYSLSPSCQGDFVRLVSNRLIMWTQTHVKTTFLRNWREQAPQQTDAVIKKKRTLINCLGCNRSTIILATTTIELFRHYHNQFVHYRTQKMKIQVSPLF